MSRTYRVRRSAESNGDNGGKEPQARQRRKKKPVRWPWILLCLLGMALIVAIGISSSKPEGGGLAIKVAAWTARQVTALSGSFAMFFCFMLILTSVLKLFSPDEPLPRLAWGLWTIFVFGAGIYHDFKAPWEGTFAFARTGGGGGIVGASADWFFRIALGRVIALIALALGASSGVSLVLNRSPWLPFSYIWMGVVSLWQWFRQFVAHFFRPEGPSIDETDPEFGTAGTAEADDGLDLAALLDGDTPGRRRAQAGDASEDEAAATSTSIATAAASLREKLARQDEAGYRTGSPEQQNLSAGQSDESDDEFAVMEQPSLHEELFYEFPTLDILQKSEPPKRPRSSQDLEARAKVIEKALLSFGVVAKVVEYAQGPTVTRFELQPGPGVKVASIVNLSQDLALALAAPDVRIEAPIPGKSAVGIEVPNKEVSMVHLRDVLETKEFRNSKSPLTVAFGKDISGRPVVTTLDHTLHLLIAGATGAGKSVCINTLIASILFKARPDQVKMVLIDPKRVELSVWSRIPHLIAPVVSDPKKAAGALRWACKEMEARYEKFTKVGTRDIDRYNQVATPPDSAKPAMPYIVIIIDELSDLMMVAPAEVEDAIFRLAQMARAAGIYLVVATQRPSVDVITGTIKANIPSRLAFAVASQIDSRTILDMAGAEKLLGRGDMLFYPIGASKPLRAQGCYISEREIDELVSFVSSQAKPQFAEGILAQPETVEKESEMSDDPFFAQALRIVVEAKQASVSLLQRKLPIGYSRAARLIDAMEVKGYVGPYEGSKPREVRLTIQDYMRLFEGGGPLAGGTGSPKPAEPGKTPSAPVTTSRPSTGPSAGPLSGTLGASTPQEGTGGTQSHDDVLSKPSFIAGRQTVIGHRPANPPPERTLRRESPDRRMR